MQHSKMRQSDLNKYKRQIISVAIITALSGCAANTTISDNATTIKTPDTWQAEKQAQNKNQTEKKKTVDEQVLLDDWLGITQDTELQQTIELALANNYELKANALAVDIASEQLNVSTASNFPELSLNLNQGRQKSISGNDTTYNSNAELSLQLSYELDVWGKLSAQQKQAELTLASVKATYEQTKMSLVSDVVSAWFSLLEGQSLLALYKERAVNLENNLGIIKGSYRLGLSSALDVYLTQNDVNQEQARVAQQQQSVIVAKRKLQTIVGQYPGGQSEWLNSKQKWPQLTEQVYSSIPANLMTARFDLRSSWFDLMAADAALAVAHKQRFPQLTLSASTGDSSDELSNLLSGNALAWSLLGNITSPIFNAGRLASLEEQARLTVQQKEQQYLTRVFDAFAEVENNLSNHHALNEQLVYIKQARENALAAESLSFNQYQKGLVTYTTVLESQRRAFDAQTSVIQLKNQLIQNRIAVYKSLGGQALTSGVNNTVEPNSNNLS